MSATKVGKIFNRNVLLTNGSSLFVNSIEIIDGQGRIIGGSYLRGTSASPVTLASGNYFQQYVTTSYASGDVRAIYNRLYLTGAGASGESLRTFTTVNNVAAATAHGAHTSLSFGTTGSITGLGIAGRNTIHVPNGALTGGTYAALEAEIYSDGASSDVSGVTEYSLVKAVLGGDTTGAATVDDKASLINLSGGANGAGNIVGAAGNEPTWTSKTHLIRCSLNGTVVYLVGVQL